MSNGAQFCLFWVSLPRPRPTRRLLLEAHGSGEHQLFSEKAHAKWHQQCQDSWKLVRKISAPYCTGPFVSFCGLIAKYVFFGANFLIMDSYIYLSEKSSTHIWTSTVETFDPR